MHLSDFSSLPKMKNENGLRKLLDESGKTLRALKALGESIKNWSTLICYWLSSRLDADTEREWEKSLSDKKFPTYEQLKTFLSNYATMVDDLKFTKSTKKEEYAFPKRTNVKSTVATTITVPISKSVKCHLCKAPHYINVCEMFMSKSPEQRYEIIKANKLCYGCFSSKHSANVCKHKCTVCARKHHDLLHRDSNYANENVNARTSENDRKKTVDANVNVASANVSHQNSSSSNSVVANIRDSKSSILLPTAVVKVNDKLGNVRNARVLMDWLRK